MAIYRQIARILLGEHKYRKIDGNVLTIAKQRVHLTPDQALALMTQDGIPVRNVDRVEIDRNTVGNSGSTITCDSFFRMFADCAVSSLDVSDYEGADVLHDLSQPLPDDLANRYDFIYNGGCLDNMFDPALAIKSFSRLLRPGGRVMHAEMGCYYPSAYLMYSPDWFFDYYVANDFVDCKVYLALFNEMEGGWFVLAWNPVVNNTYVWNLLELKVDQKVMLIVVAEKGGSSTWDRSPIQAHYRPQSQKQAYTNRANRMIQCDRSHFKAGLTTDKDGKEIQFDHPCFTFQGIF